VNKLIKCLLNSLVQIQTLSLEARISRLSVYLEIKGFFNMLTLEDSCLPALTPSSSAKGNSPHLSQKSFEQSIEMAFDCRLASITSPIA